MKSLTDKLNESLVNNIGIGEKALNTEFAAKVPAILKAIKDANGMDNGPQTYLEDTVFQNQDNVWSVVYNTHSDATFVEMFQDWKETYPKLYKSALAANKNNDTDTDNTLIYIIQFIAKNYEIFDYDYNDAEAEIRRFKRNKRGVSFGIEEENWFICFKFNGPSKLKPFAKILAEYMDTKDAQAE